MKYNYEKAYGVSSRSGIVKRMKQGKKAWEKRMAIKKKIDRILKKK